MKRRVHTYLIVLCTSGNLMLSSSLVLYLFLNIGQPFYFNSSVTVITQLLILAFVLLKSQINGYVTNGFMVKLLGQLKSF